jgi:hypothetical protein
MGSRPSRSHALLISKSTGPQWPTNILRATLAGSVLKRTHLRGLRPPHSRAAATACSSQSRSCRGQRTVFPSTKSAVIVVCGTAPQG